MNALWIVLKLIAINASTLTALVKSKNPFFAINEAAHWLIILQKFVVID